MCFFVLLCIHGGDMWARDAVRSNAPQTPEPAASPNPDMFLSNNSSSSYYSWESDGQQNNDEKQNNDEQQTSDGQQNNDEQQTSDGPSEEEHVAHCLGIPVENVEIMWACPSFHGNWQQQPSDEHQQQQQPSDEQQQQQPSGSY